MQFTHTVKVLQFVGLNFVVSTKCIAPWVIEIVFSNTADNHQWEHFISLDYDFRSLSKLRNPRKLEPNDY